jgi:hypothetical protein
MTENDSSVELTGIQECPFCISDVPAAAVRCRFCGADIKRLHKAPELAGFWVGGVLLAIAGIAIAAALADDGAWIGFIVLGIGGVLLQIATVASGVSIGMRDRDEKRHVGRYHNAWAETKS